MGDDEGWPNHGDTLAYLRACREVTVSVKMRASRTASANKRYTSASNDLAIRYV